MKKKKNKLPDFKLMSREEEAKWWDTHDLGDYWEEFSDVDIVFALEKPKEETLILRIQKDVKDTLASMAKRKGLNTSTLARMWILERLQSIPKK